MKNLAFFTTLVAAALGQVGCTSTQEGGFPGTKDSFTLKVKEGISLKQGDKAQFDIGLTRHKDFKHDLELKASANKEAKLVAAVDPHVVRTSDKSTVTVTIEAAPDAPPGEKSVVTITATPTGGGDPVTAEIKVKVTKK